ncbi:hypothetical protein COT47_04035 [Candidatus Woesearchaeota archaeon CG08_land_8_20_14_0_20_43_7]|nr:MAG: hypothetical protein COT47_04035 [Candidatus Woesearchaeota archaeon CG08_land_8_20_14_0_20_43_7]
MLLGMNPLVGLRCGMYYGITLLSSVVRKKEDVSYEDYLVNRFGRGIFDLVFGQYAKKVWGEPSELSAELARTRVAIPSLLVMLKNMIIGNKGDPKVSADVFHYPKSGIKELPENLSKNIMKKNGKILFQSEPIEIITKDRNMKQVKIRQKNTTLALDADYCISTIPLCETAKLLRPKATKEVIKHADSLKYRSLILLYVVVDKNRLFDDNWIFYPEEEFIFNRLSEQKGFSESMIPKGKTVLCVEITVDNSDPLLKAGDKKIFERAIKDLEKADIIKKKEAIDFFTVVLKDIYPIYGLDFREHVDSVLGHIDEVEGLITNGRPGLFNYNNMDHCLDMGFIAASHVISGKKNVDWVKTRRKFDEYRIVD